MLSISNRKKFKREKVSWDKFWELDFLDFNLSTEADIKRLDLFLKLEMPVETEAINKIFFTPLPSQTITGLNLLLNKLNDVMMQNSRLDSSGLMHTIYHRILKPVYKNMEHTGECDLFKQMLDIIIIYTPHTPLAIELLTDVWTDMIMPAINENDGLVVDMANVFLAHLTCSKIYSDTPRKQDCYTYLDSYSAKGKSVIETPKDDYIVGIIQSDPDFKDFLFAETRTLNTRFKSIVMPFLHNTSNHEHIIQVFDVLDADVLKEIVTSNPAFMMDWSYRLPNIKSSQQKLALAKFFWERAVGPHLQLAPQKAQKFIDQVLSEDGIDNIIALANSLPDLKFLIAGSKYSNIPQIKIILRIDFSEIRKSEILKEFWLEQVEPNLVNNDAMAQEFIQAFVFSDKSPSVPENISKMSLSLIPNLPGFKQYFLSYLSKQSHQNDLTIKVMRETLRLVTENDQEILYYKKPLLDILISSFIFNNIRATFSVTHLYHDLLELYPHMEHYPKGKETLLRNINLLFSRAQHGADKIKYETLLNEMARDRELSWLLLVYAFDVPTDKAINLHIDFEFLVKFRSLSKTFFKQDAEYIETNYPAATRSLINLLNATPVVRVNHLTLQSISSPWVGRPRVMTFFKPDEFSTNTARRIANLAKLIPDEQRQQRDGNKPNPLVLPNAELIPSAIAYPYEPIVYPEVPTAPPYSQVCKSL